MNKLVLVRDVMTSDVRTVHLDAPVTVAAKRMSEHRIRHVIVTDADGRLEGILSDRDLLKELTPTSPGGKPNTSLTAREVMSTQLTTVKEDTPVREAAAIFASKKIGCLPVLGDRGRLVGVVSVIDMLPHVNDRYVADAHPEFEFYTGHMAAATFEKNGDLVLPIECLGDSTREGHLWAHLGYSRDAKRVAVKLIAEKHKEGEQEKRVRGARMVVFTETHCIIPADDFRSHYGLQDLNTFEVTHDTMTDCIILSPAVKST